MVKELARALISWRPHHGEGVETAAAGFFTGRLGSEASHPFALSARCDADAPNTASQCGLGVLRIEVGSDDPYDVPVIGDDSTPGIGVIQ